jgi:thioester reductase-like protein
VPGDLARPRLGLSDGVWDELSRVDRIVHCAAAVHFLKGYDALRNTNVQGTAELLRLASIWGTPFCLISSLAAATPPRPHTVVAEGDPPPPVSAMVGGYAQTKWVAEGLVAQAGQRGLPVSLIRPGSITGPVGSTHRRSSDLIWRLLDCCRAAGLAPDLDLFVDLAPVDWVAQAIVTICQRPVDGSVFHLGNPEPCSWPDLAHLAGATVTTYGHWRERLERELATRHLGPFTALFLDRPDPPPVLQRLRGVRFTTERAMAVLPDGLRCPPVRDLLPWRGHVH